MTFPRFTPLFSIRYLSLLPWLLLAPSLASAAITDITWSGADNGTFGTAGNWTGGVAPGAGNRAVIDANGAHVLLLSNPAAGGLSIASGFTLTRASAETADRTLSILATTTADTYFSNSGTIVSGGTSGTLTISVNGTGSVLTNSGTLEASTGTTLNFSKGQSTPTVLTNTGGTIKTTGTGILSFSGSANSALGITGGTLSNAAGTLNFLIRNPFTLTDVTFTNGGTANFLEPALTSSGGYGIKLVGGSSLTNTGTINLTRNPVNNVNTGAKNAGVSSAVNTTSITNSGTINITTVGNSATSGSGFGGFDFTSAEQTLTNTGTINLESQSTTHDVAFSSAVTTGNGVTITGSGGEIVLKVGIGGSVGRVLITGSNGIITQSAGHTIRGAGNVGSGQVKTFTNNGTVKADDATYALTIDPRDHTQLATGVGSFINNGTVQATGAGGLVLKDGLYTNAGIFQIQSASSLAQNQGVIFTNNSGKTLDIQGAWNSGTGGGGLIKNSGAISYNSSASSTNTIGLTGSGTFTKDGSGSLTLNGANSLTGGTTINAGTVVVATGSGGSFTSATTNGNYTVTTTDTTGLVVGQLVTGTGIPAGTVFITGITGSTTFTMSSNASSTQAGTTLTAAAYSTLGTGALTLAGGTLDLGTGSHTVGAVTLAGGTVSNGTLTGSSYSATGGAVSAILAGSSGLSKTTTGTLTLSGTNTYTGATSVTGGTLLVNGSLASGSAVTIGSSGTLGGSGTIDGTANISGTLSPGNSPGILTFSNAVTLQSGSTTTIEINGSTGRGTDFDGINFNGSLTVNGGTLTFNISNPIAGGTTLNIFDGAALSSSFTSVTVTGTGGYGGTFAYNGSNAYVGTFGGQNLSLALASGELSFTAAAIPEPSAYAVLLGLTSLVFVGLRRRQNLRRV